MAQADWLLEVGVDTTKATQSLVDFKASANKLLMGLGNDIEIHLDTDKITGDAEKVVASLKKTLSTVPKVSVKFDLSGASKSVNAFARAIENNSTTLSHFGYMLELLNEQIRSTTGTMATLSPVIREAAQDVRTISNYLRNASENTEVAARSVQVYTRALQALNSVGSKTSEAAGRASTGIISSGRASETAARGHKTQEDALGRLGKIVDNTVFKFVEYEVIMRGFNSVVGEFTSSLEEASNVQFESTLQRLYAPTVNFNNALSDSIAIARKWGSDITDVQQVIGMWVKLTNDETSAAFLANEAEKVRRASGMDTIEVYRDSVAIMQQMGISAAKLPAVYDQVTNAALHLAEPLKALGKGGSEGMKDLMDGLSKFGALGHSLGFDTAGVLAIVSNQIQTMAEGGKEGGSALSNMFGALEQGGKSKFDFEKILGPEAFQGSDDFDKSLHIMEAMRQKAPELAKAMADADIRVKASGVEVEKALQASLDQIIKLAKELHGNSSGKLEIVAEAEIQTFQGRMDQAKASVQQFSLAFGNYLMPAATHVIDILNSQLLPALTANVDKFFTFAGVLAQVGAAAVGLQIFSRVASWFNAVKTEVVATNTEIYNNAAATRIANAAGFDSITTMEKVQAQLDLEAKAEVELTEAIRLKGVQLGLAGTALDTYVEETMIAKRETGEFADVVNRTSREIELARKASFGGIFNNIAESAAAAVTPMLAMYEVMTTIEGLAAGFDKKNVANAQFKAVLDKKTRDPHADQLDNMALGSVGGAISHWYNVPGAILHGASRGFMNMFDNGARITGKVKGDSDALGLDTVNNAIRNKGTAGDEARAIKKVLDLGPSATDDQKAAASSQWNDLWSREHKPNLGVDPEAEMNKRMAAERKHMEDILNNTGKGKPEGHVSADNPNEGKGKTSPEQQAAGEIQRDKRDYQADARLYTDLASGAKEYAEAIKATTEATGIGKKDVTDYTQALKDQVGYLKQEAGARLAEINDMKSKEGAARSDVSKQKKGTPAYEHASNNLSNIEANIKGATGAYAKLNQEIQLAVANNANLVANMRLMADAAHLGLTNYKDQIEDVKRKVSNSSGFSDTLSNVNSGKSVLQRGLSNSQQLLRDAQKMGNQASIKAATEDVRAYQEALDALGKTEEDATAKAQGFSDSLKTIKDNVYAENTADIAKALGIDTGSMDALNTNIEMFKKMAEEIKSAKDDYDKSLKTPADAANYNNILNEIREREQLAPILAQEAKLKADIKKTEDSSTYKMVDAEVKKYGDKTIDQITKPLGTGFGGSMINGMMKDAWSQASKSITDSMFGVDKEKEKEQTLQAIYKEHVDGLQKSADEFKETVDKLLAGLSIDNVGTESSGGISTPLSAAASAATTSGNYDNPFVRAINGTDTNHADDTLSALQDIKTNTTPASGDAAAHYADYPSVANLGGLSSSAADSADGIPVKIASIATGGSSGGGYSPLSMVIPGFSAAEGGIAKDAGLSGSANPFSQLLSGGLPAFNKSLSGGISKIMGNGGLTMGDIGLGIGVGQLSGSLFGGGSHTTNGELGGIAGSGLGALGTALGIFGPGGAILGALAGGVLGGMFGHKDNVQAMPDKYDTNFAQETANLTGKAYTSEASGEQFMSAGVASSTGGQGQISSIEELLAKYPNPQDAPAWLQPYYAQALSTFGASSTGAGVLKFGKDIANEHIEGAAGASTKDQNYQGINSLAAQIEQAQALHTNTAQAPILSINAYGTNGSYGNSIYNTPGLTSDQFNAVQGNAFQGANLNNYYGTPGVGTSTASGSTLRSLESTGSVGSVLGAMNITTNLVVDGQTLATVVNNANNATASRTSSS